jgi:hypothetical protein
MEQQWLIRSEKREIFGPYSREELQSMVRTGKWNARDEIALSGERWIFIQDAEELKKQLGVEAPRQAVDSEEEKTKDIDFVSFSSEKKLFKIFVILVPLGLLIFSCSESRLKNLKKAIHEHLGLWRK